MQIPLLFLFFYFFEVWFHHFTKAGLEFSMFLFNIFASVSWDQGLEECPFRLLTECVNNRYFFKRRYLIYYLFTLCMHACECGVWAHICEGAQGTFSAGMDWNVLKLWDKLRFPCLFCLIVFLDDSKVIKESPGSESFLGFARLQDLSHAVTSLREHPGWLQQSPAYSCPCYSCPCLFPSNTLLPIVSFQTLPWSPSSWLTFLKVCNSMLEYCRLLKMC